MVQTQTYRGSPPTVHFPIKQCGYYQSTVEREEGEDTRKQEGKGEVRERREERDSLLPNISSAQVSEGTWRWCSHMASVPRAHRL